MSIVQGKSSNSKIVLLNGFTYYLSTSNPDTGYCALRNKRNKYRAKANNIEGKWVESEDHKHNHEANNYTEKQDAEKEILELVRSTSESYKTIFNEVCER